jgi:hypothetical protein
MEEQQQQEWESELAENLESLHQTGRRRGIKTTSLIITGAHVRKGPTKVLVSGNCIGNYDGSSATRIYDCEKRKFTRGPHMEQPRCKHSSVTLPDGNVAIFAGFSHHHRIIARCEIFDAKTNTFSSIGNMGFPAGGIAAVLLLNGLVFISGGVVRRGNTNTCQLYDPVTKTFRILTATLPHAMQGHSASLLPNGKVLICGGSIFSGWLPIGFEGMAYTYIYDPDTDTFGYGPNMQYKRRFHTATTLLDGRILITGGGVLSSSTSTTEIYDPWRNIFVLGPRMTKAREGHFATLLPDGKVFIGGGDLGDRSSDTFDPQTNTFSQANPPFVRLEYASASLF